MIGKAPMLNGICVAKVGASHLRDSKPLQDSAKVLLKKGYSIFSVADGHGGEKYFRSQYGSQIAVMIAEKEFSALLQKIAQLSGEKSQINWDLTISNLERNIVAKWKRAVKNHFKKMPLTETEKDLCKSLNIPLEKFDYINGKKEVDTLSDAQKLESPENTIEKLYGTTLISCLYIPELLLTKENKCSLWIALQIGDGMCLAKKQTGEIFSPIPEDKRLGFGVTTSLCSSNAANEFRHAYGFCKLQYICACSDGVQDSYTPDGLKSFTNDIYENIKTYGVEREQQELEDFFPRLSEKGSGDDVSLAGVFLSNGEEKCQIEK